MLFRSVPSQEDKADSATVYLGTLIDEELPNGGAIDIANTVSIPAFLPAPSTQKKIEYEFDTDPQFSMVPGTFVADPNFSVTEDAEFKSVETQFMDLIFDDPKDLIDDNMWSQPQSTINFFVAGLGNTSSSGQAVHG